MYRNVMVPVDGSPFSREAVIQGLRIASQCGATLHLVRVAIAPAFLAAPDALPLDEQSLRELNSSELSGLYAIAAECRAHSNVAVKATLERGPVVDALIGYAKRKDVDLIVLRSHGRRGIARVWFGSVADGLIRESGIPVIVVRQPSVATGLESGFQLRRILVPLDGSALAESALGPAADLARMDGASITLLFVITSWKQPVPGELESALGPASAVAVSMAQRYLDSLLGAPEDRGLKVTRRVVIASDVPSTILRMAEGNEMDLVALATRGEGAFKRAAHGSVSDAVLGSSSVSTLVIHPMPPLDDFVSTDEDESFRAVNYAS